MTTSKRHDIRILSPHGGTASLLVDGLDISSNVVSIDLQVAAGEIPRMVLDVLAFPLAVDLPETEIYLPDGTRDLLIRLGWIPPEEGA